MRTEDVGELLFANQAGIKVLQASFEEFAQLMSDGKVSTLDSGASFSLSLAHTAGINSTDQLGAASETAHEAAGGIPQGVLVAKELQLQQEADLAEQQNTAPEPPVLPTGTWLGFHDGETPLLAKLAVHDREMDQYIFVNRSGIKMRQLNREELQQLIDQALVDILETRSSFRDEIARVKQQPKG